MPHSPSSSFESDARVRATDDPGRGAPARPVAARGCRSAYPLIHYPHVLLCLLLLLVHASAHGAEREPRRVVIIGSERERAIVENLRAELATQGLAVVDADVPPSSVSTAEVMRSHDAVAVIRILSEKRSAEIHVGPAETPGAIVGPVDPSEPDLSATRIAEALRIRLTRLDLTPPPPRRGGEPAPSKPRRIPERPADVRQDVPFWFSVGPAATLSPGTSVGAILHGGLELSHEVGSGLAVGVSGLFPLAGGGLTSEEGRASLHPWLVGPMADIGLWTGGQWSLWSGAGAALVMVRMRGEAEQPYVGGSDTVTSAAGIGRLYGLWHLAPKWHFRVGLAAGVAVPRPVVQFAGHRVSAWGAPLTTLSLGIAAAP